MSWLDNRKILVPVDFSDLSLAAVDTALEIAGTPSDVSVLYVVEPAAANDIAGRFDFDLDERHHEHARKKLEERFSDAKYAGVTTETVVGNPPQKITEYAEKNNFGLIVLPSQGRSGLKRLLLGSVAERVVRHANCPVMVLRD